VPEEETALRRKLEEETRRVDWLAAARHEAAQEEQAPAIEPAAAEAEAAGLVMADPTPVADAVTEDPATEGATPEDVVAGTGVSEPVAEEPAAPVMKEEPSLPEPVGTEPADEGVSTDAEPVREPGEGQEEDRS
jgi:hypothetical protein